MSGQNYSTQKLVHHPEALAAMRERRHQNPTLIHFMVNLQCNQRCHFCAFQSKDESEVAGWKNKVLMVQEYMPREKMLECIADWSRMGVKAIELTGGGEPLTYPHVDEFFERMTVWGAELALVSNGTALTEYRASLFGATNWKWARISIDAGDPISYATTRRVPDSHWKLAWAAVVRLAKLRDEGVDRERRVGVGFVVDRTNWSGVYQCCKLAHEAGADNVRVALAFTPSSLLRFPPGAVAEAIRQAAQARADFPGLKVNDLVGERRGNIAGEVQDYEYCAVKEVLCVVGGDQQVYTCCSLAFHPNGLIGSVKGQSFSKMWDTDARTLFATHDARKLCKIACLYEARNKRALELIQMTPRQVAGEAAGDASVHKNFI